MIHKTILAVFAILFIYAGVSEALSDEFVTGDRVGILYYCDDVDSLERLLPGLGKDIPADIKCHYLPSVAITYIVEMIKKTSSHEIYSIVTPYGIGYSAAQIKGSEV